MSPLLTLIPVLVGPTAGQPQPLPVRLRDGRVGGLATWNSLTSLAPRPLPLVLWPHLLQVDCSRLEAPALCPGALG